MPATFSHPIAVLPLKRFCPRWLNFAALVVGTIAPDLGYFLRRFELATFSHTLPGSFLVCLPAGCLLLMAFYLLRRPFCYVLPQPHRLSLTPLSVVPVSWRFNTVFVALVSILIGTWTHVLWDSFTHDGGWAVQRISFLRAKALRVGTTNLPVSYVIQQFSTMAGAFAVIIVYRKWLLRRASAVKITCASEELWRYVILGTIAAIALGIAIPLANGMANQFTGYLAFRVFLFRTAVYATGAFVPLFIVSSIVFYTARRNTF